MRKIIFATIILASMFFLSTCDLFTPGFGNNVDLSPPLLFVTSHANGAYVHGTITISGNFEEDVATANINVSFDNGATFSLATLNQTARTWSIGVDTTTVPDGEHDVLFRIIDTSNKVTDKKILLYFDNTPPLVIMTVPSIYGGSTEYYGSLFSVKGETTDAFGVDHVIVEIWNENNTVLLGTPPVNGTATWTATFDSAAPTYIPTAGKLNFVIQAVDKAGNTSAKYYHYSDIYLMNGNTAITIDNIYKYYAGLPGFDSGPVYTFLRDNGTTPILLGFNQDQNKPSIEIYNPDQNQSQAQNVLTNTSRLSGKAIDGDGIAVNSVEVRIYDNADTPITGWISTGFPNPNPSVNVNWSYVLDGTLVDGPYWLRVRASDVGSNMRENPRIGFTIDTGAPNLDVIQPTQGQYLDGAFTISGTASDMQGIASVEVSLDNGGTYGPANLVGNNWTFPVPTPTEGSMLIKVRATDTTAKTSSYNLQVIIDKTYPTVTFLNPALSSTVNGLILIRGTSSDNTQITNVELRLGKDATWIPMTNYYNWEYQIDVTNYANATYSDDMGGGVWKMYVHARVTDRAGNIVTKDDFYFLIDNDTDKPIVTILSPQDGATVGGSTTVTGTAIDDDYVYHVYMSLDLDNDGLYTHQYDLNLPSGTGGQIATVAGLPIGDNANMFENETYWYELTGTTAWSAGLNRNGELYHINGQNGQITARVIAVDSKDLGTTAGIKGNAQVRSFRFDDTIPGFQNMSHDSNSFVRKSFNLTGRAVDNARVDKVEISYNGGVNWTTIATPMTTPYDFSILIDTETYFPPNSPPNPSSGILYLRLKATDNTSYTKLELIDLKVDNSYPTSTYTGIWNDINGSTANSFVQGTTTDNGAVSGTKQVEVYFTRNIASTEMVYKPASPSGSTSISQQDLGDGSGSVYYTENNSYKIIIDNPYENGTQDLDGDTFYETFTAQGNNTLWSTQFNSGLIPDGAITIHYVAVDYALNKHHYQTTGYIKNYKPVVDSLTVGSDVDFSNVVDADEKYAYSLATYSASNRFKARSHVYLQVTAHDPGGTIPGITNYEFFKEGVSVQSSSSNILDAYVSGYTAGDTYFTCVITDGDSITTTTDTFWINVDKTDATSPTVGIDEFDADGNPDNNIVTGHIELPADSKFDNGVTNGDGINDDADVSGIILLTGTAWDNFYISNIKLTLDGLGTDVTVAQWNGTTHTLEAATGLPGGAVFTILTQNITPSGGHTVTWSYRWDSSTVTNVAGANKTPLFTINDAAATTPGTITKNYDVVPYITGLLRAIGTEGTTRSKYGKFMVQQGESNLQINGYNLAKTGTSWVRVYNTAASLSSTVTAGKISVNGSFTTLTISQLDEIANSGWLRIMVNSVEATNNINDNTKTNNKEDDGHGIGSTLWNDDRYLEVWRVGTSFNSSTNAQYPAMSIDSTGNLYGAWTDYTTAASVFYGTTATATPIFQMYDPAEYSDIHIDGSNNITVAYLGNYYGGSGWDNSIDTAGSINVYNASAPQQVRRGIGYPWNLFYRFEMLYHDQMLMQFQRPKVVRSGNNIHLAYFDIDTNSVKYGYALNADVSTAEKTWINIDGGSDASDTLLVTNGAARSTSAGTYVAIDVDEQGYPVIMYYDIANQTLKLARATSLTPTAPADWYRQTVFQSGDTNKNYIGQHVAIKFSTTGNLYAVCYRVSTGDLVYLSAPNVAVGSDYAFSLSTVIDSDGAVGAWADISLNNATTPATPYISYLNSSMIGTFNGLKMAYYDTTRSSWEYMIAPLSTAISDNRTNIEYKKGAVDWTVSLGYKGSAFDIVQLKPEQ